MITAHPFCATPPALASTARAGVAVAALATVRVRITQTTAIKH